MAKEVLAFIIGAVLVAVTAIVCVTYYNLKKDEHLKSNVESAIVKGIDPLSVRCAYGYSDTLCIVYATTHGKELNQAPKK
jgi:type III secretory pathway component EscV